ncbi:E3 SUMO-protein ligase ZBED1-like [Gordionus sp. m RMFG-2023]|uniref:E3 SUMO-protein ligase ZBED1-like n=1 Tax=Gordionus sp. m RMFG-2023 TaxID=3053472 RepID=UPI0031FE0062
MYFKQSGMNQYLDKTLQQDIETRWNSKLYMLKSIYNQYDDIANFLSSKRDIYKMENLEKSILKNLIDILHPFDKATKELEGDINPTLYKVLLCFNNILHEDLNETFQNNEIKQIKTNLKIFLLSKFKIDILHKIATFLCPRYRKLRMLSSMEILEVKNSVKNIINSEEYCKPSIDIIDLDIQGVSQIVESPKRSKGTFKIVLFIFIYQTMNMKDGRTMRKNLKKKETDELEIYKNLNIKENIENIDPEKDILKWWSKNEIRLPKMTKLARKILAIPATSTTSERTFSKNGRLLEEID